MATAAKLGWTVHWNGPAAKCIGQPHRRCVAFFDAVKRYHGDKFGAKWAATSLYSFGICPHGARFTGCGWDRNQAANGTDQVGPNDGRDADWYTVFVFLGEGESPTEAMVDAVRDLISEGRRTGRCGNRVLPHNAFKPKTCPGPDFTAHAKAWDRQPLYGTPDLGALDMAALDDKTLQGLVILTWLAALQRRPPLNRIAEGAEAIRRDGLAAYVASITNSPEGKAVLPPSDGA